MLRAVHNGSCWVIESELEEFEVACAWAFPCHAYRRVLAAFVRGDWQLVGARFKWRPEIDPYAFSLSIDDNDLIICWNGEVGALVLLVPSELSDADRNYYLGIAESWLKFIAILTETQMVPLSSFISDSPEPEKGWHVSVSLNAAT